MACRKSGGSGEVGKEWGVSGGADREEGGGRLVGMGA